MAKLSDLEEIGTQAAGLTRESADLVDVDFMHSLKAPMHISSDPAFGSIRAYLSGDDALPIWELLKPILQKQVDARKAALQALGME